MLAFSKTACLIMQEFAALYQKQRQNRAGMFFCLPVFLLFLRIAVSLLFSSLYSFWSRSEQGQESLEQVSTQSLAVI
jgi:hypothetical protein